MAKRAVLDSSDNDDADLDADVDLVTILWVNFNIHWMPTVYGALWKSYPKFSQTYFLSK
jgi:hypothetical protein